MLRVKYYGCLMATSSMRADKRQTHSDALVLTDPCTERVQSIALHAGFHMNTVCAKHREKFRTVGENNQRQHVALWT